jgi:hypothetical protein
MAGFQIVSPIGRNLVEPSETVNVMRLAGFAAIVKPTRFRKKNRVANGWTARDVPKEVKADPGSTITGFPRSFPPEVAWSRRAHIFVKVNVPLIERRRALNGNAALQTNAWLDVNFDLSRSCRSFIGRRGTR